MTITQTQVDNIQIDYGLVYIDFGLAGEKLLAPSRGGGTFKVDQKIRDIEFDGMKGKTKGMQAVESIDATLSVTLLDTSMDNLALAMPWATYATSIVTGKTANIAVVATSAYLTNVTMFAKLVSGSYKKITLYNAMAENGFSLNAKPKGEGEVSLEFSAHWNVVDDSADLYKIEDVASIGADVTAPTVVTVPLDAAVNVVITSNLTATFSEDIRQADINTNNFILIKASDGAVIAGALTYDLATKTALFNPTASLDANTAYIWVISNVRDVAGNTMVTATRNFTTAA